ncbi:hypothetical protein A3A71_01485 [Candidatus Berkelbacteria bacterium RIFCSPLOWO2_01_FULL_50_28]|uniref:Four helix bundle protein n=1 Tax=Candidatus Berkelbacteria bacterium RIFCSPLOWO2_01_FULL_50_28 TaxID=1797471 RepID=A0A1F5EBN7_9BACT|nr:MAG: hypothetical protein A2807_01330 [Candidatus Berkelbacteria bacterium RIFCSPHIGHO2_01_FULL_50_36]OGD62521.1 MAG: hypothetical protein A3F39_04370 [Candidatus Berkelbacteria bacterium RIFCSPHIGHO2_12_FULL_50_11]OGD64710.1 MAG: hypothetical protein A3A71_01485 [Candidatus Berkelbacteria bacterium RIFCSPLOWO2_01_FULL_50_28]
MENDKQKFKEQFYKRLIAFSVRTVKLCELINRKPYLRSIADQLLRSATSIGANVHEAKSSSSRRDYLRFFQIALKSANETDYWLIIIDQTTVEYKEQIASLAIELKEIANILGASVLTLKNRR